MKLDLKKKIIMSYASIFVVVFSVVVSGFLSSNKMSSATQNIITETLPLGDAVDGFLNSLYVQETGLRGYIAYGDTSFLETYNAGKNQVIENIEKLDAYVTVYPEIESLLVEAKAANDKLQSFFEREVGLVKLGNLSQAQKNIGEGQAVFDAFKAVHSSMREQVDLLIDADWKKVQVQQLLSGGINVVLLIILAVSMIGIALYFMKKITHPIIAVSDNVKSIAEGKLNVEVIEVKNRDEIGNLVKDIKNMAHSLREVIAKVNVASQQMIDSSNELAAAAEESTQANEAIENTAKDNLNLSNEQMESVNEVVSAMSQMNDEIHFIADSCKQMNDLSIESAKATEKGIITVDEVAKQMQAISQSSNDTASIILDLQKQSNEIVKIVDMITSITEQTNLLALNAAIEAARAGEYGKGFSVVANEIRVLAEDSKSSAGQITIFINEMQQQIKKAVALVDEGNSNVKEGLTKTEQVSLAFSEISENFTQVKDKVQVVANTVGTISNDSNQMVGALDKVKNAADEVARSNEYNLGATQQQLATAQEIAGAAQTLSMLAEELNEEVAKFTV